MNAKQTIGRLIADHKKAELMWWDEKGTLEDEISHLREREIRHLAYIKELETKLTP